MTLQWLLGWWNLVFLVPFGIALTYLAVYVSTGVTFGEADHDLNADVDADADVDHDADAGDHGIDDGVDGAHDGDGGVSEGDDAVAEGDDGADDIAHGASDGVDGKNAVVFGASDVAHAANAGVHADNSAAGGGHHGAAMSLLHLVGFGKAPLSLLVMIFLIVWGISGFATNQILHKTIAEGDVVGLSALPVAATIALAMTGLLARGFARAMPMNEPPTTTLPQLVGSDGVAVLPITDAFGLASVRDRSGVGLQVPCRVAPGHGPIDAHERVRLMRFDKQERIFYVATPQRLAEMSTTETTESTQRGSR